MVLDARTLEYLEGKKFSNSLTIPYSYYQVIPKRVPFLCEIVKNKKVIHLGCLDHLPLIDAKIARGEWLHKELSLCTSKCIGVDIDVEAMVYVKEKHGYDNIILGDFIKSPLAEITKEQWDYAILGELLEHIDNPVAYLQAIRENYKMCLDKIIITVPNAWTQTTIDGAQQSLEIINSDHRYWFTPYTLAKVIIRAGMKVDEILFANRVSLTPLQLLQHKILKLAGKEPTYNFTYASSIVAIASV